MTEETGMWTNPYTGIWEKRPERAARAIPPAPQGTLDLIDGAPKKPAAKKPEPPKKPDAPKGKAKPEPKKPEPKKPEPKKPAAKVTPQGKQPDKLAPAGGPTPDNIEQVADEMDTLREKFAALKNREGAEGNKIIKRYRYLTLAFQKLGPAGVEAPKLWDEIHKPIPEAPVTSEGMTDAEWSEAAPPMLDASQGAGGE